MEQFFSSFLSSKQQLNTRDALVLLHYLQEESAPLLSSLKETPALSDNQQSSKSSPLHIEPGAHRQPKESRNNDSGTKKKFESRDHLEKRSGRGSPHSVNMVSPWTRDLAIDLSNEKEFPPMTPVTVPPLRKGKTASGPPRRIKPTSLQSSPHPVPYFTTSTPAQPHISPSPWNSNPSLTNQSSFLDHHSSLNEEQRASYPKRQRQAKNEARNNQKMSVSGDSFSVSTSKASSHLQKLEQRMSGHKIRNDDLDSKISTHSIFNLTKPNSATVKTITDSPNSTTLVEGAPVLTPAQHSISRQLVTNTEFLDQVARMYSNLILEGRVPNVTSQIHFVIQLLTVSGGKPEAQHSLPQGSSRLFESVHNCVYFAVTVLSKIRNLLFSLDSATLQLLSENPRVGALDPELANSFSTAAQSCRQEVPERADPPSLTARVPFLEEQDNSKNYPSMKAFHAFKKQRDIFYTILREWEGNHGNPEWSFRDTQRNNIRALIRQYGEICSLSHLANLFKRQLIESCKHPVSTEELYQSDLAGQIKNTDPHRLRKLTERFFLPSSGAGPCPPPSFTATEEFFKAFILEADSYVFNQHVRNALSEELLKLHEACSCAEVLTVTDLIQTARIVAKFLGLLDFLPYSVPTIQPTVNRDLPMGQLDKFVTEARVKGHLSLTIPWVVQYLSMMDSHAASVPHCRQVLMTLIDLYKKVLIESQSLSPGQFLVTISLGWLFENPNVPTQLFFNHISSSLQETEKPNTESMSLDSLVSTNVVYTCCPFLNELRALLTEFVSGLRSQPSPMRKIKPLSTSLVKPEDNPSQKLQIQLRESFFRGHPPHVKQVCEVTSERVAAGAIDQCVTTLLPRALARAMDLVGDWLRRKCQSHELDKSKADSFVPPVECEIQVLCTLESVYPSVLHEVSTFTKEYCVSESSKALQILLAGSSSHQIIQTASVVCSQMAQVKTSKWIEEKLRFLLQEELTKSVERVKKSLKSTLRNVSQETKNCKTVTEPQENQITPKPLKKPHSRGSFDQASLLIKRFESAVLKVDETISTPDIIETVQQLVEYFEERAFICSDVLLPASIPLMECSNLSALSVIFMTDQIVQGFPFADKSFETLNILAKFWKCMKSLKADVPYHDFLSSEAFGKYFQKHQEAVWRSLASVLTSLVEDNLVTSPVLEGMWLCRWLQISPQEKQRFLEGATIFLNHWYRSGDDQKDTILLATKLIHFSRLAQLVIDHAHSLTNLSKVPIQFLSELSIR